jgi:L-ascorbate metabolism protein UlaG (beta-lactamase superfamily)
MRTIYFHHKNRRFEADSTLQTKFVHNPGLPIIKPNWPGNSLDKRSCFINHEFPFTTGLKDVWKWQTGPKPHKLAKKNDTWKPQMVQDTAFATNSRDCLVWLGHAWFFLRLGGVNMLLDPVLFKIPLVKQIATNPYRPDVFGHIDLVFVSHDHRDHMDQKSLAAVSALYPKAHIITGLNNGTVLRKWCSNPITEMGWYQQWQNDKGDVTVTYLPTRHWSRRYLNDTNRRLWGAFMIEANGKKIYFGSDSGFGSHFKELNILFSNIDIAMLGIGAFRPEWFMHQAHMSPWDAVKAFHDTGAKAFLPMHFGTLDLSDEPPGEPAAIIRQLQEENKIAGNILMPHIGATFYF